MSTGNDRLDELVDAMLSADPYVPAPQLEPSPRMHCALCQTPYAQGETVDDHNQREHPAIMAAMNGFKATPFPPTGGDEGPEA